MITSPLFFGAVILLLSGWSALLGSGRNVTLVSKEHFATWHQEHGRTVKMLAVWGLVIGVIFLAVGVFKSPL
jgi:uncharacterized membrane protein YphA (DoxX/SURF4 family)